MSNDQVLSVLLGSEIRGDLLTLFHRNPGLIDTMEGIARRIGRTGDVIEDDVRELVSIGILKQKKIGNSHTYVLDRTRDKQILDEVARRLKSVPAGESK